MLVTTTFVFSHRLASAEECRRMVGYLTSHVRSGRVLGSTASSTHSLLAKARARLFRSPTPPWPAGASARTSFEQAAGPVPVQALRLAESFQRSPTPQPSTEEGLRPPNDESGHVDCLRRSVACRTAPSEDAAPACLVIMLELVAALLQPHHTRADARLAIVSAAKRSSVQCVIHRPHARSSNKKACICVHAFPRFGRDGRNFSAFQHVQAQHKISAALRTSGLPHRTEEDSTIMHDRRTKKNSPNWSAEKEKHELLPLGQMSKCSEISPAIAAVALPKRRTKLPSTPWMTSN